MDAIHIIMATSTSANPHNAPNTRIESLARKRKISAVTFLGLFVRYWLCKIQFHIVVFGILLIVAGSLLASFEKQRFSVSFIVFGYDFFRRKSYKFTCFLFSGIGVIFAFMYWISAEKILIALRKLNAERMRVRINWIIFFWNKFWF